MNPALLAYGSLAIAIVAEVTGSAFLQKSAGFTRLAPMLAMGVFYLVSFFFLAQSLKMIPLGVAYAIWGGLGIVLTAMVSALVFRQALDLPAILGMAMIVGGVVVMNGFSQASGH
jgi:small multidrug resistance pump